MSVAVFIGDGTFKLDGMKNRDKEESATLLQHLHSYITTAVHKVGLAA
jgi:hypothetical protein